MVLADVFPSRCLQIGLAVAVLVRAQASIWILERWTLTANRHGQEDVISTPLLTIWRVQCTLSSIRGRLFFYLSCREKLFAVDKFGALAAATCKPNHLRRSEQIGTLWDCRIFLYICCLGIRFGWIELSPV